MTAIVWDQTGKRLYETGVDQAVLYLLNGAGIYDEGFGWNGVYTVTESPGGAESTKQYADNKVYLNLISVETFGGTIEAFTYPDEWAQCDGSAEPQPGVAVGQQSRKTFGLCYRTRLGNDVEGNDHGYKLHLVWGATASPSEKAFNTINDSPEALTFSWDFSTIPVDVGVIDGVTYKPTASMTIDSTRVDSAALAALETILYGSVGTDPSLPTPAAVVGYFAGTITNVFPTAPSFNSGTHTITIPSVTGVEYRVNGEIVVAGALVITQDTIVTANPATGYVFTEPSDSDWFFDFV